MFLPINIDYYYLGLLSTSASKTCPGRILGGCAEDSPKIMLSITGRRMSQMDKLTMDGSHFYLGDKEFRILSGAIHYFRVVPEYWRDRLLKLKACGLNTVETYVAWNVHEPQPGMFNFSGLADLEKFIQTAAELGLYVIVRPGPYICSEWDLGGLPAWLLKDPAMRLRCSYEPYLEAVDRFFDELIPRLIPLQSTQKGPIIAVQVENEYGSYGNDGQYLAYLRDGLVRRGIEVPLFTSDGATDWMLQGGTLPDVFMTANFGSRPRDNFQKLLEYQPDKPLVCMEFWNGWFDHWGEQHHTRDPQDVADTVGEMLEMGASFNFYMFHGGTNFGFYNGANHGEKYEPTITSYDDDALVSESGDLTPKYHAVRQVLAEFGYVSDTEMPKPIKKKNYGKVELGDYCSLFESTAALGKKWTSVYPQPMEMFDQNHGFILYRTRITGPRPNSTLEIKDVHDRAYVFLDQEFKGILMRSEPGHLVVDVPTEGATLDILVENMGRVNYGPHLHDRKGITHGVLLQGQFLYHWDVLTLPLDTLDVLSFSSDASTVPGFFRGTFSVEEVGDTFLALPGWTKGVCFLNGFNLGRYWNIGPQRTLYIPSPLLRKGENELIVFELEGMETPIVELRDEPDLG